VERRCVAGRFHPGRLRLLPGDRQAFGPGRLGRVRLLRVALRYFWGLRLHLVCTLGGLPILFALTGAKADERETLRDMLDTTPEVQADHPRQTIIGDKNYYGREFEQQLAELDVRLLRPRRKGEVERLGSQLFKPLQQIIESVNETFKNSSTSNDTVAAPPAAWPSASYSASSR